MLRPLIERLRKEDFCEAKVLVTGMHLSPSFGNTYQEIEEAGIPISARIPCLTEGDEPKDISSNMAMALTGFGDYFAKNRLDLLIVLGDRYETLAVCIAAMNAEIPIAHIHGGESTEGQIDEAIRHSITKMSQLHFPCTEAYRRRIIQMGEQPARVFQVGALAVENTRNVDFMDKEELEQDLGFSLGNRFGVVTYHPVTLEEDSGIREFQEMLGALDEFRDMRFLITKANADAGGRRINQLLDEFAEGHENVACVTSLGMRRYLSAVRLSNVVIGNSSSGITEAPCLHTPTVNIGDRQKGRLMPESVLSCPPEKSAIVSTIRKAISKDFQAAIQSMPNPFGEGHTSEEIVSIIRRIFEKEGIIAIQKNFYDIPHEKLDFDKY